LKNQLYNFQLFYKHMTNYNIRILPEGNMYVGYAMRNNEVIHSTKHCSTAQQATIELQKIIESKPPQQNVKANVVSSSSNYYPTELSRIQSTVKYTSTPRRCCGRG
jgi:hypothetical protein